ncbi:MAG TPA: hypothetical protein VLA33_02265 [Gemmatimonadota bacterium]|nr:hypothetical protein [Gemmatimonadota bacterium]
MSAWRSIASAALATLLLALPAAAPLAAQEATAARPAGELDASTPEAATVSLVDRIRTSDYEGMADLMHPAALDELRELFQPVLEAEQMAELRTEVFGTPSVEEATALSGRDIYETIISFALGADPATSAAMQSVEADVVGHIMEGDTAHVVYRMNLNIEGFEMSQTAVASYRQHEGRWLGLLTADLRGMVAGLRQALDAQTTGP